MDSLSTGSSINSKFSEVGIKVQLVSYLNKKKENNLEVIDSDVNKEDNIQELTIDDFINDFRL